MGTEAATVAGEMVGRVAVGGGGGETAGSLLAGWVCLSA